MKDLLMLACQQDFGRKRARRSRSTHPLDRHDMLTGSTTEGRICERPRQHKPVAVRMHVNLGPTGRGSNRVSESNRGFSARNEPPLVNEAGSNLR
jgi:hypothetical protein